MDERNGSSDGDRDDESPNEQRPVLSSGKYSKMQRAMMVTITSSLDTINICLITLIFNRAYVSILCNLLLACSIQLVFRCNSNENLNSKFKRQPYCSSHSYFLIIARAEGVTMSEIIEIRQSLTMQNNCWENWTSDQCYGGENVAANTASPYCLCIRLTVPTELNDLSLGQLKLIESRA